MADPILERIHELPVAASWNGFFPQDKPGGPTECVSVATVEARLELDGFVKTATLVAGYQPLENQRLRTTDSPAFAAGRIAGLKIQDDPVITTYGNIYGSGIATPSDTNWSASFAKDGSNSLIRGQADVALQTPSSFARLSVAAFNISNKLQIAGVDRITAAGGFVGTSLQISGATANKLARFDASKNLVSYDLTLTIGATGKTIDGTGNQSWSLAEIGAQAAGTYLTPSNLSGTANQVAQFTATNTVGSDNGFTTVKTSGISRYAKIGNGTQAGGAGFEASAPSNQVKSLGFLSNNLYNWELLSVATSHNLELLAYNLSTLIDKPLVVNNASGGAIELGGSTLRPVAISGGLTLRQHATLSTYGAIYGSGVTPGHANYGLLLSKNGDHGNLNGAVNVALTVGNSERVTATAAGSTLAGTVTLPTLTGATTRVATINAAGQIGATDSPNVTKLQIAGVDRITGAGGFIGTSLQITGATANKLARFNASKNLVSYDLVAADIPTLAYASSVNPAYSQSSVINSTPVSVSWGDPRNQIIDGTASAQVTLASFVAGSEYVFLRRQGAGSVTFSTAGAGSYIVYHNTLVATQNFTNSVIRAYCDGSYWYLD